MSSTAMHYVGLDVHHRQSSLEMLDEFGKSVKRITIKGGLDEVVRQVGQLPRPLAICYEASCGYGYLHERLVKICQRVEVAHPGQLRLIFRSKRKNDRFDTGKIAKVLYLDMVPKVHVPSVDVRSWRKLIEFRQRELAKQVRAKNQLRAILREHAIAAPKGLWTKRGRNWLKEVQGLGAIHGLQREMLLEELADLGGRLKRIEEELKKIADRSPAVALLRTIPGIGIRTAEAFVAYVDDPHRFNRTMQFGTYFGLVPCQDSSASVNRLGHITKDGPATVRKLLCEAAWRAIALSPTIRGWFERITHGDPDRRKIAVVAIARKLAVVMGAMMKSGETWRYQETPIGKPKTERTIKNEQTTAKSQRIKTRPIKKTKTTGKTPPLRETASSPATGPDPGSPPEDTGP